MFNNACVFSKNCKSACSCILILLLKINDNCENKIIFKTIHYQLYINVERIKIFLASSKNACVSGFISIVFQHLKNTKHIIHQKFEIENAMHDDMFI